MASTTWQLVRAQIGDTPGNVSLVCDTGYSPWTVTLKGVQDGEIWTTSLCVEDGSDPCDPGGIAALLKSGGKTLYDNTCP